MSSLDKIFYYIGVITTFGSAYIMKVIILKAIDDSKYEQVKKS